MRRALVENELGRRAVLIVALLGMVTCGVAGAVLFSRWPSVSPMMAILGTMLISGVAQTLLIRGK